MGANKTYQQVGYRDIPRRTCRIGLLNASEVRVALTFGSNYPGFSRAL
jgi:hypothetical protein